MTARTVECANCAGAATPIYRRDRGAREPTLLGYDCQHCRRRTLILSDGAEPGYARVTLVKRLPLPVRAEGERRVTLGEVVRECEQALAEWEGA